MERKGGGWLSDPVLVVDGILWCCLALWHFPAVSLQSFLQAMTLGTVMLAAFAPQGIEPHGMTFANEATL